MNLQEIDDELPNGFHDMHVDSLKLDFVSRTATFVVSIWIGDLSSSVYAEREAYRRGELVLSGLEYCIIDAPDPRYAFAKPGALWFTDLCEAEPKVVGGLPLPNGAFAAGFFVNQWNSFVRVAALDASLSWT